MQKKPNKERTLRVRLMNLSQRNLGANAAPAAGRVAMSRQRQQPRDEKVSDGFDENQPAFMCSQRGREPREYNSSISLL